MILRDVKSNSRELFHMPFQLSIKSLQINLEEYCKNN